jgi:hypothetical protein
VFPEHSRSQFLCQWNACLVVPYIHRQRLNLDAASTIEAHVPALILPGYYHISPHYPRRHPARSFRVGRLLEPVSDAFHQQNQIQRTSRKA